jgi:hypothetical protein
LLQGVRHYERITGHWHVTVDGIGDAAADGPAIQRVRPCGGRSIAPFPNRRVIFYRHAISDQGFDPILFHSSGGVGDEVMSIVEPNAVTGVGQYLGYETLELQQFFLGHAMFLVNDQRDAACVEHGRALAGLCRV